MEGPAEILASARLCVERRDPRHLELSVGLARPLYVIAIASNAELPPVPGSLYFESGSIVDWTEAIRQTFAMKADGEVAAEREARERAEAAAMAEREARERAEAAAENERDAHQRVRAELAGHRARLVAMYASSSWRLTAPLRAIAEWLSSWR
jgi:hypothetical protein